jgi:DNA-binding NarL/FixJ family response regulator
MPPLSAKKKDLGVRPKKRGVLIVDDHPLFRKGIVQLLSHEPDLEVRAEAANSAAALGAIRREKFDLAVLDIGLQGGANGIELTKSIKAERPNLPVLVLSMHDEALYAERALRAGARGYVMKREAIDCVLAAMRSILDGEIYISPSMSKRMIFEHIQGSGEARSAVDRLTDRELEILQLIGTGHEVRAIANELHLSTKTVEAHRAHIKEKLNLGNAREVVRFATNWVNQQR